MDPAPIARAAATGVSPRRGTRSTIRAAAVMEAVVIEPQTAIMIAAIRNGTRIPGKFVAAIALPIVVIASFSRRIPPIAPPIAVIIRALIEMIDAPRYTEIKAEEQYDKIVIKK